jgi:hypothetical protein
MVNCCFSNKNSTGIGTGISWNTMVVKRFTTQDHYFILISYISGSTSHRGIINILHFLLKGSLTVIEYAGVNTRKVKIKNIEY